MVKNKVFTNGAGSGDGSGYGNGYGNGDGSGDGYGYGNVHISDDTLGSV
jgi:hypothetical protein